MARKSAEERREEIVSIASRHFAEGGYHGTSTEAIAREAGISQPYLFRLFRTKRDLFLVCVDECYAHVLAVFAEAAAGVPEGEKVDAMGEAYGERLLPDRHALMMQMQAYVTAEPEIRDHVRAGYRDLIARVAALGGVADDSDELWHFFATGMMMNVTAMLELDWKPESWR
jgi:AcrR family transcriptional regulator